MGGYDYYGMRMSGIRYRQKDIIDSIVEWKGLELTEELEFQAHNYAYLESHMVRTWMNDDNRCSLETLCERMAHCVPRPLFDILDSPVDPKPAEKLTLSSMYMAFSSNEAPPLFI